jgi:hypothetical protein
VRIKLERHPETWNSEREQGTTIAQVSHIFSLTRFFNWHYLFQDRSQLYCVCQKPAGNADVIYCNICTTWYHRKCAGLRKTEDKKKTKMFFCPICVPPEITPSPIPRDPSRHVIFHSPRLSIHGIPPNGDCFYESVAYACRNAGR